MALACSASLLLVAGVNCLAAGLSLLGLCSYVLLYTIVLKPRTTRNIVIGGVAGAIPPLVGAAAATGPAAAIAGPRPQLAGTAAGP